MAKHVIYSHSMEPLTVLELSEKVLIELEHRGYSTIRFVKESSYDHDRKLNLGFVEIGLTAEWFKRNSKDRMFIFTKDEQDIMYIKSDLLPGQGDQFRRVL